LFDLADFENELKIVNTISSINLENPPDQATLNEHIMHHEAGASNSRGRLGKEVVQKDSAMELSNLIISTYL